jgi:5-methylcytosine-specific restriction endonuclease McrA
MQKINKENSRNRRLNGKFKEWQQNNKEKLKEYSIIRNQNKKHNIPKREWNNCKIFFENSCCYCGITEKEHRKLYGQDFHKDHFINDGPNDLSNCVPACKSCNSEKLKQDFFDWYNDNNSKYNYERFIKIVNWIENEYKKYIKSQ